jgi:hypothetical protein
MSMPDDRPGRMGSARSPPRPGAALIWSRLFIWKLDAADISRMASHASYRSRASFGGSNTKHSCYGNDPMLQPRPDSLLLPSYVGVPLKGV